MRGLEVGAGRAASLGAAWNTRPALGAVDRELEVRGAALLVRVFREVSSTIVGGAPATLLALGAIDGELDVRGIASLAEYSEKSLPWQQA